MKFFNPQIFVYFRYDCYGVLSFRPNGGATAGIIIASSILLGYLPGGYFDSFARGGVSADGSTVVGCGEAKRERLEAVPSSKFKNNYAFFQLVMPAYNIWRYMKLFAALSTLDKSDQVEQETAPEPKGIVANTFGAHWYFIQPTTGQRPLSAAILSIKVLKRTFLDGIDCHIVDQEPPV